MASGDSIPRNDADQNHDDVVSATPNAVHPLSRLRGLIVGSERAGLTDRRARTLHALATYCGADGVTWVGVRTLAAELGRSPGTVQRHLTAAVVLGLLERSVHPVDRRRRVWRIPLMVAPQPVDISTPEPENPGKSRAPKERASRAHPGGARLLKGIEVKKKGDRGSPLCGFSGCHFAPGAGWVGRDPDCPDHGRRRDAR